MVSTVLAQRRLDRDGAVVAFVTEDRPSAGSLQASQRERTPSGRRGCIVIGDHGRAVMDEDDSSTPSVPLPENMDTAAALDVLATWPAWRIVRAAALEIGSGVVVAGDGWLRPHVLRACGWYGCLWRAAVGSGAPADAEYYSGTFDIDKLRGVLPRSPDAIVIISDVHRHLPPALALVANAGALVLADVATAPLDLDLYPDVHKRGLRVQAMTPWPSADVDDWNEAVVRLPRLIGRQVTSHAFNQ